MEAKKYVAKQTVDHWRNKRRNKNYLETNENNPKYVGLPATAILRRMFIAVCLFQENKKISTKQPTLTPEGTRKRTNPKLVEKRIKIRAEISEIKTKNRKDQWKLRRDRQDW